MTTVVTRGEVVYECDVCNRRMRTPANKYGLEVMQRCTITHNCRGKLHRVTNIGTINNTPAFPPEVPGVIDWYQRQLLYTHTQHIPSNTWVIKHDLGGSVLVHPYVNQLADGEMQLTKATATTTIIDQNTIQLTFSEVVTGSAQCVALSSQTTSVTTSEQSAQYMQLSGVGGVITVATLVDSPVVSIGLSFGSSSQGATVITYSGLTNTVPSGSPWVGATRVLLNGKQYTVRSFNVTQTAPAPAYFNAGAIVNGSSVTFDALNGAPLSPGEGIILLGSAPYAYVDRINNRYVDMAYTSGMFYADQTLFVPQALIKTVYPHILNI